MNLKLFCSLLLTVTIISQCHAIEEVTINLPETTSAAAVSGPVEVHDDHDDHSGHDHADHDHHPNDHDHDHEHAGHEHHEEGEGVGDGEKAGLRDGKIWAAAIGAICAIGKNAVQYETYDNKITYEK